MRQGGRYIVEKGKEPRRVEFTRPAPSRASVQSTTRGGAPGGTTPGEKAPAAPPAPKVKDTAAGKGPADEETKS
jgi:hypothetical protein